MLIESKKKMRVVGISEYVSKKSGEVVPQISLADGVDMLQNVGVTGKIDVSGLVLFSQDYTVVFNYVVQSFGDKVYRMFSIDSLTPVKG